MATAQSNRTVELSNYGFKRNNTMSAFTSNGMSLDPSSSDSSQPPFDTIDSDQKFQPDLLSFITVLSRLMDKRPNRTESATVQSHVTNPIITTQLGAGAQFSVQASSTNRGDTTDMRRGIYTITRRTVALKRRVLFRSEESAIDSKLDAEAFGDFIRELNVFTYIDGHPNIVTFFGVGWDIDETGEGYRQPDGTFIPAFSVEPLLIMEQAPRGTLEKYLLGVKNTSLTIGPERPVANALAYRIKRHICRGICAGLTFLHNSNIIHGDLKPQNILVFDDLENKLVVKLTDFGCSMFVTGEDKVVWGTQKWRAPECGNHRIASSNLKATDTYSFGLVVLSVMTISPDLSLKNGLDELLEQKQAKGDTLINYATSMTNQMVEGSSGDTYPRIFDLDVCIGVYSVTLHADPTKRSLDTAMNLFLTASRNRGVVELERPYGSLGENISKALTIEERLDDIYHISINLTNLQHAPEILKSQIVKNLEQIASDSRMPEKSIRRLEAYYHLSLCHIKEFGIGFDQELAFSYLKKAVIGGLEVAQNHFYEIFDAIFGESAIEKATSIVGKEDIVQWLARSTKAGNETARKFLKGLDTSGDVYKEAMIARQTSGSGAIGAKLNANDLNLLDDLIRSSKDGVDQLKVNAKGDTLLHMAAACGLTQVVLHLIKKYDADIHVRNYEDETPLFQACQWGQYETTKELLNLYGQKDSRVDPESNKHGASVFNLLASFSSPEAVREIGKRLLYAGFNLNPERDAIPLLPVALNRLAYIETFLELSKEHPHRSLGLKVGILDACHHGKPNVLARLLEEVVMTTSLGGIPSVNFNTEEWWVNDVSLLGLVLESIGQQRYEVCSQQPWLDLIKVLTDYGLDFRIVNTAGDSALFQAVNSGNLEILQYFVENCDEVFLEIRGVYNSMSVTPLQLCVLMSYKSIFSYLLSKGCDRHAAANTLDYGPLSILHLCALTKNSIFFPQEILKIEDMKLSRFESGEFRHTVLRMAIMEGNFAFARLLIEAGADVNEKSEGGESTLLSYAVTSDDMNLRRTKFLLSLGDQRPHQRINKHLTVLHLVVEVLFLRKGVPFLRNDVFFTKIENPPPDNKHREKLWNLLLKYTDTKDFSVRNKRSRTPLQLAVESGDKIAVKQLLRSGAPVENFHYRNYYRKGEVGHS